MIDPYKMVLINMFGALFIFILTLIYRFVVPKRKINLLYLLIIISILSVISILRVGDYQSGDFNIHIFRSIEFYKSISEGNIIPSWAGDLNATYGYPLFSFNYILPYYFIALIHFIGFSYITSMKIILGLNLVLSGFFMYVFSKAYLKDNLSAFAAAIFYLFVPYHLISIHFKITIGEIFAFTIIPLLFIFINRFHKNKKKTELLQAGFFLGILALCHIYIAILTIPILLTFFLVFSGLKLKSIIYALIVTITGALISAFQWSAPIIYYPYLFVKTHPPDVSALYYPSISDLLYSPWRFGFLFQGPMGEISSLIGYVQIFFVIFLLFQIIKNEIKNKAIKSKIIFWLALFFLLIILMGPGSIPIWKLLPFIGNAGTHRILLLISFITSILGGYFVLLYKDKKIFIYTVIMFAIISTILNWGQRTVIPQINDDLLIKKLPYSTSQGEAHFYANTKWVNSKQPWFTKIPLSHLEILNGSGTAKSNVRTSTIHSYDINALTQLKIRENTLYFPGWTATSNGKIIYIKPDKNGIITFNILPGKQTVVLSYNDLPIFSFSKLLSAITFLIIIGYLLYVKKQKIFNLISKALNKA